MKVSSIALLVGLAAEAQAQSEYDQMRTLIDRVEENESAYAVAYADKEAEVASLVDQLSACQAGEDSSFNSPSPSPTPETGSEPPILDPTPVQGTVSALSTSASLVSASLLSTWTPSVGDSWNYNLDTPVNTNVDVDVIFIDMDGAQSTIDELHANGKFVSCYINIGMIESWRDDAEDFPSAAIGRSLDTPFTGTKPVDPRHEGVKDIMEARVITAAAMSCDAIEPDELTIYAIEGKGFDLTEEEQIEYNVWFAETVHANGMLVGLKNALALVPVIGERFDFAVNERCLANNECDVYNDTFLDQGKPVFNVEYADNTNMCVAANEQGLDTIIKNENLKAPLCSCADSTRDLNCPSLL